VTAIESGYRPAQLARRDADGEPALATHREYVATWREAAAEDATVEDGPTHAA